MIKIYVDTEEIKQDLLKQSKYIHDLTIGLNINSNKINTLMHIYTNPDMIIVRNKK